jgi:hypothetical protein
MYILIKIKLIKEGVPLLFNTITILVYNQVNLYKTKWIVQMEEEYIFLIIITY